MKLILLITLGFFYLTSESEYCKVVGSLKYNDCTKVNINGPSFERYALYLKTSEFDESDEGINIRITAYNGAFSDRIVIYKESQYEPIIGSSQYLSGNIYYNSKSKKSILDYEDDNDYTFSVTIPKVYSPYVYISVPNIYWEQDSYVEMCAIQETGYSPMLDNIIIIIVSALALMGVIIGCAYIFTCRKRD